MKWELIADEGKKTVICLAEGAVTYEEAFQASKETAEKAHSLGFHALFDARKTYLSVKLLDAYRFPAEHGDVFRELIYKGLKTAMIYNPKEAEFYRFYETTANNNGVNIRVFTEEGEAFKWLSG